MNLPRSVPIKSSEKLGVRRLDVYQCTVKFLELAQLILVEIPKGNHATKDQLDRASSSVLLNIAEGAGKWSVADKKRHYQIAKGSATECIGILDVCRIRNLCRETYIEESFDLLDRIVAMLTKLCG